MQASIIASQPSTQPSQPSQPIANQPISQSASQPIVNQPISQSVHRSIIHRPVNRSIVPQSVHRSTSQQSVGPAGNQSTGQPASQSIGQSVNRDGQTGVCERRRIICKARRGEGDRQLYRHGTAYTSPCVQSTWQPGKDMADTGPCLRISSASMHSVHPPIHLLSDLAGWWIRSQSTRPSDGNMEISKQQKK